MLQAERGDLSENDTSDSEKQEVQLIYKTLSGISSLQAQGLVLSLCSSLQMYGVTLFPAYGENQTEYFLGPTPVGVVIYKNKQLVGKYFWPRITKLHFKDEMFELRVFGKKGSETSFFFQTSNRCDCKRLWRCCVEHHTFFRMSESNPQIHKLKLNSAARSPSAALPQLTNTPVNNKTATTTTAAVATNQSREPMMKQTAPPAAHRSGGGAKPDQGRPSAPWENSSTASGLFNPKFPPNTKEEEQDGGRPQRRSRSLDGDRPIRAQRRRSRSHGNSSSGSESEKSNSEQRWRRTKSRGRHGDQGPDSTSQCRARSHSLDARTWKHIQKQLVEPDGVIDRQTEEIPYKEVRVLGEPIRTRRSTRGRRHQRWASYSQLQSKMVLPLPVTTATDTSCRVPTNH
uniref:FERM domain-containing protein n=1 Tax=Amphiprion ocellaris TaxID=80972 RepID=A0AAQ5ZT88_AMPOC